MRKLILAWSFLIPTMLLGQGVLGVGNFIHVVANLDRSIEFYHDGLGLEMTGAPGPRAFSANAVVSSLYDAPGAQSRVASFKIPDSPMAIEIVEFQGLNATPVKPESFDPGAITLTLPVKNLAEVQDRLYRTHLLLGVSAGRGGQVIRDPDGIFISLVQPSNGASVAAARLSIIVEDVVSTAQFYGHALGFSGTASPSTANLKVPVDEFPVDFRNSTYADRKAVHSSVHDPGSGVLRLRVRDFDAALKSLKENGATVVSASGEPVNLGRNRAVIVRDKNNLFVQILESAPPAQRPPAPK